MIVLELVVDVHPDIFPVEFLSVCVCGGGIGWVGELKEGLQNHGISREPAEAGWMYAGKVNAGIATSRDRF